MQRRFVSVKLSWINLSSPHGCRVPLMPQKATLNPDLLNHKLTALIFWPTVTIFYWCDFCWDKRAEQLWGNKGRPDHCYSFLKFFTTRKASPQLVWRGVWGGQGLFILLLWHFIFGDLRKTMFRNNSVWSIERALKEKKETGLYLRCKKLTADV